MRKLNLLVVAVMLLFTGSIFGQSPDKSKLDKELQHQIEEVLDG